MPSARPAAGRSGSSGRPTSSGDGPRGRRRGGGGGGGGGGGRRRGDQVGGAARPGQGLDRGDEAHRGDGGRLAGGGAESRPAEEAVGLGDAERARVGARRARFPGGRRS